MNTGFRLRKLLQSKGISQKPFLTNNHADDQYKKNWPSLKDNSLTCIRYVRQYCFPKNRIVLPRARRLFPGNTSHAAAASTVYTTLAYSCVFSLISIRSWGINFLIGLFLSRVTHRLLDSSSASYSFCYSYFLCIAEEVLSVLIFDPGANHENTIQHDQE
jgi:hypothetical protein